MIQCMSFSVVLFLSNQVFLEILKVIMTRAAGCGRCEEPGGCGGRDILSGGQNAEKRLLRLENVLGVQPGDSVVIAMEESSILRAAAYAYMLPTVLTLLGAVIGMGVSSSRIGDLGAFVGAVLGVSLGFGWIRESRSLKSYSASCRPVMIRKTLF